MKIQFACECGRRISTSDSMAGRKSRCPACGAVLVVPNPESAPPKLTAAQWTDVPRADAPALSDPPKIHTPVWLLYLGVLTTAAIIWGTLATIKLQERTRQMNEAIRRADTAESASKVSLERAEAIRRKTIDETAIEAGKLRAEAQTLRDQAEASSLREEAILHEVHPNRNKLVRGENLVHKRYIESLTITESVLHVKIRNADKSSIKPDFSVFLFDKNGMETATVHISWLATTVAPGQVASDEQAISLRNGQPFYYSVSVY